MTLRLRVTALLAATALLLSSCATNRGSHGEIQWSSPQACVAAHTVGGVVGGALLGVVVATATGGRLGKGAAIGSVAGGTLAFAYAWGKCFASFTKVKSVPSQSYSAAQKQIGYQSSHGPVVKILQHELLPSAIASGDKPEMHATYYVMAPQEKDVTVTETLALKIYDPKKKAFQQVGETSETIVVAPGERKATSEIPIPENAEEGKFFFVFTVTMKGASDTKEMPLTITGDEAILAKAKSDAQASKIELSSLALPEAAVPAPPAHPTVVAQAGSKSINAGVQRQLVVTAKKVNLRDNPNLKSKIIAKTSQGEKFPVVTSITVEGKQWHYVKLSNGKCAWITGSNCKLVE